MSSLTRVMDLIPGTVFCFRGMNYRVTAERREVDTPGAVWAQTPARERELGLAIALLDAEAENAKLREVIASVLSDLPQQCTCHAAYADRGRTDPSCGYCDHGRDYATVLNRAALFKEGT